jgi:hypothetical protein
MQKVWLAAAAFVIGAALGMGLLVAAILVFGFWQVHNGRTGISVISPGQWSVLAVPVLCGCAAAWWAVRRVSRAQG